VEYCVDFDDYCDNVADNTIERLQELKAKYPEFKCTLFTIPRRCSEETIARAKALGYVALAPHGWRHTRGECLSWSVYEALEKLTLAAKLGCDAPVFRAPAWLLDDAVYTACDALGYVVADHVEHNFASPGQVYTYNFHSGHKPGVRCVHGHVTPVAGNYINDMLQDGRLNLAKNSTFLYPWEVAVKNPSKRTVEE
jgi:hypothetical protein